MSINLEVILDNFFIAFLRNICRQSFCCCCWCLSLTDSLQTSWTYWKNCKARGGQDLTARRKKVTFLINEKFEKKGSLSLNKFFHISKSSFIVWKVCWMVPYLKNRSFRGDDDEGHLLMTMYAIMYLCVYVYVGKTLCEALLVHVTICWFSHQFVSY